MLGREVVTGGVACVLLAVLWGCGDDRAALDARLAEGRAAYERGETSELTRIARELVASHPDDAEVRRLASAAALMREHLDDAIEHAEHGLARADADAADLRGALHLLAGTAAGRRYKQLGAPRDWGLANSHLEDATTAGRNRLDAAVALVALHASGDERADRDRLVRFARLVLELDTGGEQAAKVRQVADSMGLSL